MFRFYKQITILLLLMLAVACTPSGAGPEPETATATSAILPEADKPLMIRIHNSSSTDFDSVKVQFPDQTEEYGAVAAGSSSDYHAVSEAYRYAYIIVTAAGQQYELRPIDYVGEELLAPGDYTYVLTIDDQPQLQLELVEGEVDFAATRVAGEAEVAATETAVTPTEPTAEPAAESAMDLDGTHWVLTTYGPADSAASVLSSTEVTAEFRDGEIVGSAGCNQYSTTFTQDSNTISTGPVISTRRACAEDVGQQEAAVLQGLDTAVAYEINNDTLTIEHENGILVFTAAATLQPETADETQEEAPESILIFSPGSGSRVTSPFTIMGESDFVFEGTLSVEVVSLGDTIETVGTGFAMMDVAEMGARGPYSGEITFTSPAEPTSGRISVFSISARDGHVEHLASTMVTLLPEGSTPELVTAEAQPEAIAIYSPERITTLTGGTVHITGYAAPTFEQNLAIELLDADGQKVGEGFATIASSMGEWGPYEADVTYSVSAETPGSLCVTDFSPADGNMAHRNCIPVTLAP